MQQNTEPGDSAGLKNMQQLIQLRWMAVGGQILTIAIVHFGFGIRLPLDHMGAALAFLVAFNLFSLLRWRRRQEVADGELFIALLVDVGTLTVQLYLSGGATNPFIFLYLLQVSLGAVLLRPGYTRTMVAVTAACFMGLTFVHRPLAIPMDNARGLASPYIQGLRSASRSTRRCWQSSSRASAATCGRATRTWRTCASAPPRRSTSYAWASWPPARPTSSARRWRRCR